MKIPDSANYNIIIQNLGEGVGRGRQKGEYSSGKASSQTGCTANKIYENNCAYSCKLLQQNSEKKVSCSNVFT